MKLSLIVGVLCRCALLLSFAIAVSSDSDIRQWRSSDPTYVPFTVWTMAVSSDNRFVALTVEEHPRKDGIPGGADALTTYVLDLTNGNHRGLGSGSYDVFPAPHSHTFLVYHGFGNPDKPFLIDGLKTIRTLEVGDHGEGWWNPRTSSLVFATSWPGDREGFNGITIWDEATDNANRVHLYATTESLSFCPVTGHFFTEHWSSDDSKAGTDEYDAKGDFVKTAKQDRGVFSARCHYVLPFSALAVHGPDDWGIYDATSGAQLQDFPWNEDGKHDLHSFIAWNPVYDHLLLMYSKKAGSEMDSIDVLDVRRGAVVKSWTDTGTMRTGIVWSGDGSSVVAIRDHHVIFEKIKPDNLL